MINDFSLRKFCINHKVQYDAMWRRVSLKGMKPEEALQEYLEKKKSPLHHWYKYTYNGMTVRRYCLRHGINADVVYKILKGNYKFYTEDVGEAIEYAKTHKKGR